MICSKFNNIIDTSATVSLIFKGIDFDTLNIYKCFVTKR
jgi:hypothetical protein